MALELARTNARSTFNKDLAYRRWATRHGGVYVPITAETPPNPHLADIPERDITTPSGKKLTLMNPAYMTRQVHELSIEQYGVQGHITSLKPLRPENAPDAWEARALQAFEAGAKEVSSLEMIGNELYMRLMRPLVTDAGCLKCHGHQGYKVGDIRGGISASVLWKHYHDVTRDQLYAVYSGLGGVWMVGIAGLWFTQNWIQRALLRRKQAEEELRESEERYRQLFESNHSVMLLIDPESGDIVDANPAGSSFYGWTREELKQKKISDINTLSPDEIAAEMESAKREARNHFFFPHRRADGTVRDVEVYSGSIRTKGKTLLFSIIHDISERRQAEDALRASEQLFRTLAGHAPAGIFQTDAKGDCVYVNELWCTLTGLTAEQARDKGWEKAVHPDDRSKVFDEWNEGDEARRESALEYRYLTPSGAVNWVLGRTIALKADDGTVTGYLGSVVDITDRKLVEAALRKSEEGFKEAQRVAHIGSWSWNAMTDTTYWSEELFNILYLDPKLPVPNYQEHLKVYTPASIERLDAAVKQAMQTGEPYELDLELANPDATRRWVVARGEIVRNADGSITGLRGTAQKITERKRAEEVTKESHERLVTVLNGLDAIVYVADMKTYELLFVNNFVKNLFGDIAGQPCWKTLQTGQSGPCAFCTNDKLLDAVGNPEGIYHWEFQNTVSGRWYDIRDRALQWVDGRIVRMEIATDITERKRAEEQLLRSLREKEVMLKEIHHRVKNNMQVIYSLLNLQAKSIADKTVRTMFEESRDRVNSMSLIHERLYRSEDLAHIDFKEYLQSLVSGIADTYKRHDVIFDLDMEPLALDVNVGIPCGLIVNELVSNCLKHAFPGGRKGMIKLGINRNSESNNVLFVEDNGIGFPETVDFRNTSSLGLQLVNVLTGQIHGTIELSKEEGTRFSITFPGSR
jgi:PAS domain S-box-containing protein